MIGGCTNAVVIGVVTEFDVGEPDGAGLVGCGGGVILFIGAAGEARPFGDAIDKGFSGEQAFSGAVGDIGEAD